MSLADDLAAVPTAGQVVKHPPGWEPGLTMTDGVAGTLTTAPTTEKAPDWDHLLAVWDLDPALYEVIEPVQYRAWDAAIGNGEVRRMFYYRANVQKRREHRADVTELLAVLKRRRPKPAPDEVGESTFVWASGDTQLGKPDGGGTAATIERFRQSIDCQMDALKLARKHSRIGRVLVAWLGDCLEGNQSQGGALRSRLDLTLTEQLRVYRRLLTEQVSAVAALGLPVDVAVVPGNHDEVERIGGTMSTRYDDSWAVEGASSVCDAFALSGKFDHVRFIFPRRDELTVTVQTSGTIVGMAHGHQFRGAQGWRTWWAGQAAGRTPIGSAHLLLAGHLHHWHSQDTGKDRTFIQVPALDGGSTWFRHRTGDDARSGSVSLVTRDGRWDQLRIG